MGILEQILEELQGIRAALESGASVEKKAEPEEKPKAKPKAKAKDEGPSLEDVQNKIRELVAADDDNKEKIAAAIKKLGGKRAGDFEGEPAKLKKLLTALEEIESGGSEEESSDEDDLL